MNPLDSRTWLVWGVCSMVPLLFARQPLIIAQMLAIVIAVRVVCTAPNSMRWGWIIRIAVLFAVVGVVINALTVRSGNQIAFHLPGTEWPITWNAIAYGVVSGMAMVCLVLVGTTTAAGLNWIALTRVLPSRLAPLAASGSVAWAFLPSASQALTDIREAQAARGHHMRSGRDVLPIVIPLLDGSLSRALTMSEALEARGFGATLEPATRPTRTLPGTGLIMIIGLLLLAYAISLSANWMIWISAAVVAVAAFAMWRSPAQASTTRYREHRLTKPDAVVMIASVSALIAFLVMTALDSTAVVFNPYPDLAVPAIDFRFLLALAPLLAPALYPHREVEQ